MKSNSPTSIIDAQAERASVDGLEQFGPVVDGHVEAAAQLCVGEDARVVLLVVVLAAQRPMADHSIQVRRVTDEQTRVQVRLGRPAGRIPSRKRPSSRRPFLTGCKKKRSKKNRSSPMAVRSVRPAVGVGREDDPLGEFLESGQDGVGSGEEEDVVGVGEEDDGGGVVLEAEQLAAQAQHLLADAEVDVAQRHDLRRQSGGLQRADVAAQRKVVRAGVRQQHQSFGCRRRSMIIPLRRPRSSIAQPRLTVAVQRTRRQRWPHLGNGVSGEQSLLQRITARAVEETHQVRHRRASDQHQKKPSLII